MKIQIALLTLALTSPAFAADGKDGNGEKETALKLVALDQAKPDKAARTWRKAKPVKRTAREWALARFVRGPALVMDSEVAQKRLLHQVSTMAPNADSPKAEQAKLAQQAMSKIKGMVKGGQPVVLSPQELRALAQQKNPLGVMAQKSMFENSTTGRADVLSALGIPTASGDSAILLPSRKPQKKMRKPRVLKATKSLKTKRQPQPRGRVLH